MPKDNEQQQDVVDRQKSDEFRNADVWIDTGTLSTEESAAATDESAEKTEKADE